MPSPMQTRASHAAVVVGTGPAGLAAALALQCVGADVTLVGPDPTEDGAFRDARTTALFGASIDLLRRLGLWPALEDKAAALTGLRIVDDAGGLMHMPELLFRAEEAAREAYGYNMPNAVLVPALASAVRQHGIRWLAGSAEVFPAQDRVIVRLDADTELTAALVAGADGRQSHCRTAIGSRTAAWSYPQTAVVTSFEHSRPHHGISSEFHRRAGPLTTVPLSGARSSLVWVETPDEAARLVALSPEPFCAELELRLQGLLGSISDLSPRMTFPLSGLNADPIAAQRVALVGEAAHVMPPIGAQGLNLALRDVAWLAEAVRVAIAEGRDIGGETVMATYAASRKSDVLVRSAVVDLVNRSLLVGFAPFDLARRAGLIAVATVPWLRRLAMDGGVGPDVPLPPARNPL